MTTWRSFTVGEPPHTADDWWPVEHPDVGSADIGSNYLWDVRIRLQIKVRQESWLACPRECKASGYPRDAVEGQRCAECGLVVARILAQTIIDARCLVEDSDSQDLESAISASIVNFLKDKAVEASLDFSGPPPAYANAWERQAAAREGRLTGTAHPKDVMWHVGFAEDAVKAALRDWARKDPTNRPLLLAAWSEEEVPRPPLWRRVASRIPLLRNLFP